LGNETNVPAEQCGWKITDERMWPILTDHNPPELLEMIRFNCKIGCSSLRCSCNKIGLKCTAACGECRRICVNMSSIDPDSDTDDEHEDF
jgi:hypothetical protein